MKNKAHNRTPFQQRFSLMLALLLCLFVSSVEYLPEGKVEAASEQAAEQQGQHFLDVAVDAVVPFVVQFADTVFYLISLVFRFDVALPLPASSAASYVNTLAEILFERIISTKGP
jgi:hypothetical protein